MQILSNTNGPNSGKSIFCAIESAPDVVQWGWDDKSSTSEGYQSLIAEANKSINLVDYLYSKISLEELHSSSGWSYRTICPFHKHGHERTPSFFINSEQNRFYCQACGIAGGIVEYISMTYKRPKILVAEHILRCINKDFQIDSINTKKINDRKKFQAAFMKLSDIYREFIKNNIDDEDAVLYINKCFFGIDSVIESNESGFEKAINEIIIHVEKYLERYAK